MEELAEITDVEDSNKLQKKFIRGPNTFTGSDQFMIVFNVNNSLKFK